MLYTGIDCFFSMLISMVIVVVMCIIIVVIVVIVVIMSVVMTFMTVSWDPIISFNAPECESQC